MGSSVKSLPVYSHASAAARCIRVRVNVLPLRGGVRPKAGSRGDNTAPPPKDPWSLRRLCGSRATAPRFAASVRIRGKALSRQHQQGYALILAIVVLAAMVAIATPFLLTTRGSARASVTRAGDARARIEADAALRAMMRRLESSDVEVDATPGYDSELELAGNLTLPKDLYNTRDPKGVVVSASADAEQTRIDVNSASVYGLGLLVGRSFLSEEVKKDASEITLENADDFPESGFVWIEGELVRYQAKSGGRLTGCDRGVMGSSSGPYEAVKDHGVGTPVVDARAHHIAKFRIRATPGEFRPFETLGEILRVKMEPANCPPFTPEDLWRVSNRATVHGLRNGHERWSASFRILTNIPADGIKRDFQCEAGRYLGVGSTVKIESPGGVEYGIVVKSLGNVITLEEPMTVAAQSNEAKVSFLVPAPLFVNGISESLLTDMLRGLGNRKAASPDPVQASSAALVAKKIGEKPLTGWKDLLERVLLPLGQENVLTARQIEAILRNFENSNDNLLAYSTVPITFTSGSRFRVVASASVNAASGAERGRDEIEAVAEVHPQNHGQAESGIRAVARQVEFDELFRLSRRARGWMTYPWKSSYFDGNAEPPSRARAYLQGLSTLAEEFPIVQSEDPSTSWAQLAPARSAFPDEKSVHFDDVISIEGHDVQTLQPVNYDPVAAPLELTDSNGYLYPGSFSGWFRWNGKTITGTLFDLGSKDSYQRDRITLSIDNSDLVLRMRDPMGDDVNNVAGELKNEIRYPVNNQIVPNVWYHFTVAFRGSGPGEFALLVDGIPRGKRSMLTHLTADLQPITQDHVPGQIAVESTEGFPGYGVLHIGDELVEYTQKTANSFLTQWATGAVPGSYTGGRGVRSTQTTNASLHDHKAGDVVKLYGYANRIMRDVNPGGGKLTSSLGRFSAGKLRLQQSFTPVIIEAQAAGAAAPFGLGRGIKADTAVPSLRLDPLDASDANFIKAFSSSGGYAVMFQFRGPSTMTTPPPNPSPLFGAELIYYAGVQGSDTLTGIQRGVSTGTTGNYFQASAFVISWAKDVPMNHNNDDYRFWVYVVPCSIPVSGGSYYKPQGSGNQLDYGVVQLIELGAAGVGLAETTEWVQYDTLLTNQLCVLAPWRWDNARMITAGPPQIVPNLPGQQPPVLIQFGGTIPQPTPPAVTYTTQQSVNGHYIGDPPTQPLPGLVDQMQNGISGAFGGMRFRGTNSTWSRDHVNSTEAIPAFITKLGSLAAGRPGRLDRFKIVLPKGVNGLDVRTINWTSIYTGNLMWVASSEILPSTLIPIPNNTVDPENVNNVTQIEDSRDWTRIVVGPSGELPAVATQFTAGGAYDGTGDPFAGELDELEFSAVPAAQRMLSLGKLIVDQPVASTAQSLTFHPAVIGNPFNVQQGAVLNGIAFPGATRTLGSSVMGTFPADSGVLLLGNELIGYDNYDPSGGVVNIAPNGRGILGTKATSHSANETAIFLDGVNVSQLNGNMPVGGSLIDVEDASKYPLFGTVLIGDELMHFTRNNGARLEMPEFEDDPPGTVDTSTLSSVMRKGYGIFRGRYGSIPNAHNAGELVFRFPYRYWDRWVLGTDAPELQYLQCDEEMSTAFWERVFWKEELPVTGVSFECLARLDARSKWSAYTSKADGMWLYTAPGGGGAVNGTSPGSGTPAGDGNRVGTLGERLELRFGVRFANNTFEPLTSPITNDIRRNDAWKVTPRLRAIAVERFGESRILWKEERK